MNNEREICFVNDIGHVGKIILVLNADFQIFILENTTLLSDAPVLYCV